MNGVIAKLLAGDVSIVHKFVEAKSYWDGFFQQHRDDDIPTLARALDGAQFRHEDIMGERDMGKSAMVFTALGSLYDEVAGFGDNKELSQRIVKAFETGMTSLEVKHSVDEAATMYFIDRI